jgi:hypothetical protein
MARSSPCPHPFDRSRGSRRSPGPGRRGIRGLATVAGAVVGLLVAGMPVSGSPAAAAPVEASCTRTPVQDRTRAPDAAVQQLVNASVAAAAAADVVQSVAVLDRTDGHLVAASGPHRLFNSESMVKLYTAAYFLAQAQGKPDAALRALLEPLITVSDNAPQIDLWQPDIITTVVARYGLSDSRNGPSSGANSWGSDRVSAQDLAEFVVAATADPEVGPWLTRWMARTARKGADGYDQAFGLNAVSGDHGSKQGWSDPDWTPYNLHSVGWTGTWSVAILQTSPTASSATMRSTSTCLAQSLSGGQEPGPGATDPGDPAATELKEVVDAVRRLLLSLVIDDRPSVPSDEG